MNDKSVAKYDNIQSQLADVGFDLDKELLQLEIPNNGLELPRIRIEHKDNGKHRMFIDFGESYLDEDLQEETMKGNSFEGIVFAEQFIRALWEEGEAIPKCSAIDGTPISVNPLSENCVRCKESIIGPGRCKLKVRLWLLVERGKEIKPFIFALSPTSIKHWNLHKKKLKRSKLPVVAMKTVFSLEDVKKNSYRWAEVNFDINGIAPREALLIAKEARAELERVTTEITARDFDDPGDKIDEAGF